MASRPRTLYEKIWDAHTVARPDTSGSDDTCLLYIDRHLVHEVTSPQAFEALRLAVDALGRIGDAELTDAAHAALARIIATLPERQSRQALHAIMRSFDTGPDRDPPRVDLAVIRDACWNEAALDIDYTDLKDAPSRRVIWPLGLSYSQHTLMLLAHCRLRMDFRVFHVNRIRALRPTRDSFRPHRVSLVREYAARRDMRPPIGPCNHRE